jgi:hypothetical protein
MASWILIKIQNIYMEKCQAKESPLWILLEKTCIHPVQPQGVSNFLRLETNTFGSPLAKQSINVLFVEGYPLQNLQTNYQWYFLNIAQMGFNKLFSFLTRLLYNFCLEYHATTFKLATFCRHLFLFKLIQLCVHTTLDPCLSCGEIFPSGIICNLCISLCRERPPLFTIPTLSHS